MRANKTGGLGFRGAASAEVMSLSGMGRAGNVETSAERPRETRSAQAAGAEHRNDGGADRNVLQVTAVMGMGV